jgi:hypothetical protein
MFSGEHRVYVSERSLIGCMVDDRSTFKDMTRQRMVQAATGIIAIVGIGMWLMSVPFGEYIAAAAIIIFAVATLHWIDDEEKIEEAQIQQVVVKK